MKIVSYNVNGVRSAIKKGLLEWIEQNQFDVICLQETKAHAGNVPTLLIESLGYRHVWHSARRKGYSGVATWSRQKASKSFAGIGVAEYDLEGRVLRTDFGDLTILNCYFPNGSASKERHQYKMRFLEDFRSRVAGLIDQRPNLVVVGDYNIAHQTMDLHDPARNQNASGFLQVERDWFDGWLDLGFVDSFRHLWPRESSFTWWRTTQSAKQANQGWRLDYQSVSDSLVGRIKSVSHLAEVEFSDHCPVLLELSD